MSDPAVKLGSDYIPVCSREDLIRNSGVCALLPDNSQVALFYLPALGDDAIYCLGNHDPAGKANVLSRGIVGDVGGEPVVASPLYKHHYSLNTGQCLEDDTLQVPVYPVRVEGDTVLVQGSF